MKRSFNGVLSMILAVIMLALVIPTGFAVTATADEAETVAAFSDFDGATAFTDTLYVNKNTGGESATDKIYTTLADAMDVIRDGKNKFYRITVQTDTAETALVGGNVCTGAVVEGTPIDDGNGGTRMPKIQLASSTAITSTADSWMTIQGDPSVNFTAEVKFLNVELDIGNDEADIPDIDLFSLRDCATVSIEGCAVYSVGNTFTATNAGTANVKVVGGSITAYEQLIAMDEGATVNAMLQDCKLSNKNAEVPMIGATAAGTMKLDITNCEITPMGNMINNTAAKLDCTLTDCYVSLNSGYRLAYHSPVLENQYWVNGGKNDTGKLTLTIDGGEYIGVSGSLWLAEGHAEIKVFDGYFSTAVASAPIVDVRQPKTSSSVYGGDPDDTHMYIYGGTFINTISSGSWNNVFVIRPHRNSSVTIYGGTFVTATNGAVIGNGESSNSGYLYIYGGNFIKNGTESHTMFHNGTGKNYYIWGGNFYTQKSSDNLSFEKQYMNESSTDPANRVYDKIVSTPLAESALTVTYPTFDTSTKQYTESTVTAAVGRRLTPKAPATGYVYDESRSAVVGFEGYQLAAGVTAASETADLRIIYNINADIADTYKAIGFWVSMTDTDDIYYSEYANISSICYAPPISAATTEIVYSSLIADGETVQADDGQVFALLEITGIGNADFDTNIYVRAYAIAENGSIVYGDVMTVNVAAALN